MACKQLFDRRGPFRTGQLSRFLGRFVGFGVAVTVVSSADFPRRLSRLHEAVVHPVPRERLARAAFRLGQLVFVMREHQVESAAMNVKCFAQIFHAHGRALDMPAGAARSPGAVPGGFARLRFFPQREVGGVPLAVVGFDSRPRHDFRNAAVAEGPVIFVSGDVEINVSFERVGKALVDQPANHVEHFRNVLGRIRKQIDRIDPHRLEIIEVVLRHLAGQLFDSRLPLCGTHDQLVVDVGDVDHKLDGISQIREVPLHGIEDDRSHHVPDVRRFVNRRPAQVHPDVAGNDRLKFFFLTSKGVIDAK